MVMKEHDHQQDIQVGQYYQVVHLNQCDPRYRKRLMSMGFTPASTFEVLRFAPLGDPVEVKIKGSLLAIRRRELLNIHFKEVAL